MGKSEATNAGRAEALCKDAHALRGAAWCAQLFELESQYYDLTGFITQIGGVLLERVNLDTLNAARLILLTLALDGADVL